MVMLTNSQAKYIADKLRECERALERLQSPYVDRSEIEFAISLIVDHPEYQEPKKKEKTMETEEMIGAVILALDLYRMSLAKQYVQPDSSKYGSLIEHGTLLVEGLQDMIERFREEGK